MFAQNSVPVQLRLVGNGNDRISSNTGNFFQIIKYDLKGAAIGRAGIDSITSSNLRTGHFIANKNFHRVGVKG